MKYLVLAFVLFIGTGAYTAVFADPITGWMLMEAPSHTDMDVENHAYQINGAVTLDDCLVMKATYYSDAHRWCEELIKPLDMVKALEVYHGS